MLTLCTKNLYFTLNNAIYVQNDGVAMCSPIGPILANASMVNLKTQRFPGCISKWRNGDGM